MRRIGLLGIPKTGDEFEGIRSYTITFLYAGLQPIDLSETRANSDGIRVRVPVRGFQFLAASKGTRDLGVEPHQYPGCRNSRLKYSCLVPSGQVRPDARAQYKNQRGPTC